MPTMETSGCCWVGQGEQNAQLRLRPAIGQVSVLRLQWYSDSQLGFTRKPDSMMFKSTRVAESTFEYYPGIITHWLCDPGQ